VSDCQQVAAFLQAVSARSVGSPLPDADLALLQQSGLLDRLSPDQRAQLAQQVAQLEAAQKAIEDEQARQQQQSATVDADTRRTHSILFHLQGVDKAESEVDKLNDEQAALQAIEGELAKREAEFQQLLVWKSELDVVTPYNGDFVALTTAGRVALRDLAVALYRVGDDDFPTYWAQAKAVDASLNDLSGRSAVLAAALVQGIPSVDPGYLWAIAIGLAKQPSTATAGVGPFLSAYGAVSGLTSNVENRLLAAEVLSGLGGSVDESVEWLGTLTHELADLGVPSDAATGVAAVLLAGRRGDGTFATDPLTQFLRLTPSYESAALLAIVNKPFADLSSAFQSTKALFASWNYSISEDTELASAYLALSDLPAETIATKMAILSRGVGAYLEYPLVAAAVLASIPVLEANETLNLLEKAYETLGTRTGPIPQGELITLAVRLVHGVDVRSVNELDPTKAVPPTYPSFVYPAAGVRLWMPMYVVHGNYFATYSAIGGAHPGHFHAVGGGGWGGGFGG
jgi:hypothetical protein